MQKILLLSDTHSYLDARLEEHIEFCDQIWHGGDWGSVAIADTLMSFGKPVYGAQGSRVERSVRAGFRCSTRYWRMVCGI